MIYKPNKRVITKKEVEDSTKYRTGEIVYRFGSRIIAVKINNVVYDYSGKLKDKAFIYILNSTTGERNLESWYNLDKNDYYYTIGNHRIYKNGKLYKRTLRNCADVLTYIVRSYSYDYANNHLHNVKKHCRFYSPTTMDCAIIRKGAKPLTRKQMKELR